MNRIHLLNDDVINKIAAGEVIERPASVLKELLENAIDAGAWQISIELEDGGIKKISVRDNGRGINKDDLVLAITRHATSKISDSNDLYKINSLGFRGEALASIASVSRFSIDSRQQNDLMGQKIIAESGADLRFVPTSSPQGTTVTVSDLFYNVPARNRFLKAVSTEFAHCLELVQSLCMARPDLSIRLIHNKKERLSVSPISIDTQKLLTGDEANYELLRRRAKEVYADELISDLIPFYGTNPYCKIYGLASPPGVEKATSKHIATFVNGRWVKDKILRFGINRGYHSHLLKGKYPQVFLYLESDPSLIDVNVHPAKTELRFQYSGEVQNQIALSIREALRSASWLNFQSSLNLSAKTPSVFKNEISREQSLSKPVPVSMWQNSLPPKSTHLFSKSNDPKNQTETKDRPSFISEGKSLLPSDSVKPLSSMPHTNKVEWFDFTFIGYFAKCYLMFEKTDKLLCVDQHAFHERILYEQLCQNPDTLLSSQPLIIPEAIELKPSEVEKLSSLMSLLATIGINLKILNDNLVEVHSVPCLLTGKNLTAFVGELLKLEPCQLTTEAGLLLSHDILATVSCHGAVKAGEELTRHEINTLLKQAETVDFYHNCPHGRRVIRVFSKQQVESWFDRV